MDTENGSGTLSDRQGPIFVQKSAPIPGSNISVDIDLKKVYTFEIREKFAG
jgi:hypothetical protein